MLNIKNVINKQKKKLLNKQHEAIISQTFKKQY